MSELLDILGELWLSQEETALDYGSIHCGCDHKKNYRRWHIEITDYLDGTRCPPKIMSKSGKRYEGKVIDIEGVICTSDDIEEVKEAMNLYFADCEYKEET